jgi:1-deoxy-D-xylulose-5-phosphate reductoisomerase
MPRRLIILGSTGSIGTQAIEVVEHLARCRGDRFEVVGLASGRNAEGLSEQARRLGVRDIAIADERARVDVAGARVRRGPDAAEQLVREVECDIVLGAMVGAAGLPATLAAVELGRHVALANKETLVAAGALVIPAAVKSGSKLLPVDSEHCGVWQCLQSSKHAERGAGGCPPLVCGPEVTKVILTASGGPFRTWDKARIEGASPREALNHPTWSMGPKVTIDSASLTNKALELIEAHWLFGLEPQRLGVLVHPQSVVHALVEYADGNVIAQLGPPDMRSPIQYALTWPARPSGISRKLDWRSLSKLEFAEPDLDRFPALSAGFEVIRRGGTAGAVFNAANEAAVQAFLAGHDLGPGGDGRPRVCDGLRPIPFGQIAQVSRAALDEVGISPLNTLADALAADAEARRFVQRRLER